MAAQPDISQILAALAATNRTGSTPSQTPSQPPPQQQPPPTMPQAYPSAYVTPTPPAGVPAAYGLPQPTNSGSVDLSSIKPVNTGSVNFSDVLARARNIATEKGLQPYSGGRSSTGPPRDDPRLAGRPYRHSRSRSRSPPRRDGYRDNYNPYRDERRDDPRRSGFVRERSRSPPSRGRDTFSPARNYPARDRSPPDSETITIESSLVGLVIGRQGENLRRIEQDTGTRIQFITGPEMGGPQRQCRISGPPRSRIDAKREIFRIIDENGGQVSRDARGGGRGAKANAALMHSGDNSVQIMVPDRTVGLIIGRQGETIRDLQDKSGCHVNIVGENKSVNGLRPVNLIGSREAAARAKELILEIVDSDTRAGPPAAVKENNRGGNFDMQAGPGKINDTIMVPSEAVGMIIGKGGETIKEMQNSTGCKINVSQASGADIEREIGLVGTRQSIEDAKQAIWEKVDTVREKNGGVGSRGRGRDNDPYSDRYSQPQQQSYAQQPAAGMPQQPAAAPGEDGAAGADPYAMYGGYQNYISMWYAAIAQQQQTPGQTPGQQPPGA
ncbi:hypothetical protein HDK77DRAFT_228897 [Phyllosticta capitalensis]|uniref:K Homology domain-containing protein n=1 Tax=Phyllosticta capitalensis TaxID=121624 RepID=A0ABR1Z517_9PEZI